MTMAIDAGQYGITEVKLADGSMRCNETFKRYFGRMADQELTYSQMFEAMLPEYREQVSQRAAKAREDNTLYQAEYAIKWPDGSVHWISAYGRARYDADGKPDRMVGLIKDITEQKHNEQEIIRLNHQLTEKEETLRIAVVSARLGTWHINAQTREFIPSPRLKELFGYYPNEHMPYDAAVTQIEDSHRERVVLAVEAALSKGESYDLEYPIIGYHDKQLRWVRATGKLYTSKVDSSSSHFSGTVADISARKQEEQRKQDFIGIVSHELRSPLTSLTGYIQMLNIKARKSGDSSVTDTTIKARRQVEKMRGMITDFLDVARTAEGKLQLTYQSFDMADVLKTSEQESLATVISHKIIYHPVEYTPVKADLNKMEQVLVNLVNNAVKYSPAGSTISIACVTKNGQAYVSIADEGMGIALKDQPRIFDRFYRVESDQMKNLNGFGIGLYLCKEIIEQHGGTIGVENILHKGSIFWFDIPVHL